MQKEYTEMAKKSLSECKIEKNKNGTINTIGKLTVQFPFEYLPRIQTHTGDFICCCNNTIKTLHGVPKHIKGNFNCSNCKSLETLHGAPKSITNNFYCTDCTAIKTLQGAPKIVEGSFNCCYCTALKTLKGAPQTIGSNFFCYACPVLETLHGAPNIPGYFQFDNCKMLSKIEIKKYLTNKYKRFLENAKTNQGKNIWCFK